jgi:hypothetical protein
MLRVRSSSPSGRVIDIVVIGLAPALIAIFLRTTAPRLGFSTLLARRFPSPCSVEELEACFIVRDHNGQALAYVYFLRRS